MHPILKYNESLDNVLDSIHRLPHEQRMEAFDRLDALQDQMLVHKDWVRGIKDLDSLNANINKRNNAA